jgi:hypothetical protein
MLKGYNICQRGGNKGKKGFVRSKYRRITGWGGGNIISTGDVGIYTGIILDKM